MTPRMRTASTSIGAVTESKAAKWLGVCRCKDELFGALQLSQPRDAYMAKDFATSRPYGSSSSSHGSSLPADTGVKYRMSGTSERSQSSMTMESSAGLPMVMIRSLWPVLWAALLLTSCAQRMLIVAWQLKSAEVVLSQAVHHV